MKSKTAEALQLKFSPVAINRTDICPDKALQFAEGKRACVLFLFAQSAKGQAAVIRKATCGCNGAITGLGFGDGYQNFAGGSEGFYGFLSSGNKHSEEGRKLAAVLETKNKEFADHFLNGECYKKNPDLVRAWHKNLPILENGKSFVVFQPLEQFTELENIAENEKPELVVFTVNALQLASLVVLANYGSEERERVIIPFGSGCQQIGILPFAEIGRDLPRAVVGLTDISARKAVKPVLGADLLTFAVTWKHFLEMEEQVSGSFLERPTYQGLI